MIHIFWLLCTGFGLLGLTATIITVLFVAGLSARWRWDAWRATRAKRRRDREAIEDVIRTSRLAADRRTSAA